jgi:hypothetical protein
MNIANEKDIKPDVALAEGGASPNEERYLAWGIWRRHVLVPGVIPVRAALARLLRAPSLGMGGRPPLWTEVRRRWLPADAGTRGQGERRLQISPSSSSLIVGQVVQTRRHTDLPPVKGTGEAVKTTVPNQSGTGRMVVQAQRNTVLQTGPTGTVFHAATPGQSVIVGQVVQPRRHTDLPPARGSVAPFAPFTAQRAVATGQPVVASPATPESSPTAELPAIHAQEPMPETNVAQLAEQVYELLVRRLACERERRGL